MKKYVKALTIFIICTIVICITSDVYNTRHVQDTSSYHTDCDNCEKLKSSKRRQQHETSKSLHKVADFHNYTTHVQDHRTHHNHLVHTNCDNCEKPEPSKRSQDHQRSQSFYIRDYSEIMEKCKSECVNEGGAQIPKSVFLVKTDPNWKYTEWISVLSIHLYIKPSIIYIVSKMVIEPDCWWNRTLAIPHVIHIIPEESKWVTDIGGIKLTEAAHICDFMKTTLLYELGGILMDTDAIAIKSFDSLLNHQVVLARDQGGFVVNGLMIAQKHSCFMCNFVINAHHRFNGKWNTHSTWTLNPVWEGYKDVVILEQYEGFFPFSPNEIRLQNFLLKDKASLPDDVSHLFAVHLYHNLLNKNEVFRNIKEQSIDTYSWLKESKSFGAEIFQSILPQGFTEEHFNTSTACMPIAYL